CAASSSTPRPRHEREGTMLAAELTAYGDPEVVVEVRDVPEARAPGADEVILAMELAPINPGDLLMIRGTYAIKPALPAMLGDEGVGTVLAAGKAVRNVAEGDRVAAPLASWTWRERLVVAAAGLQPLPQDAPLEQLAMIRANAVTAQLLVSEFADLQSGGWIV